MGYNERWDDFFMGPKKSPQQILNYAKKLRTGEFKEYFDLGIPANKNYFSKIGKSAKVLGALGVVGALLGASASAESISCDLKNFVDDKKNGKDDWAYVDALSARQDANALSPFAGDVAMRSMYGWK